MHQPRPHGLSSVGAGLTDEDAAAVELTARRLTNLKDLSGVPSLRMVRALPDGGYVIAQDMGGVFKAITHKPIVLPREDLPEGVATPFVPMMFSGTFLRAVLRPGEKPRIKLTEQCRKRLSGYGKGGEKMPAKEVELERFDIGYSQLHQELGPDSETILKYTQYAALRPTWFSGAMAEAVQIVGGYGRHNMPDDADGLEVVRMLMPNKVLAKVKQEIGNLRLPGYTGFPDKKGEIQYDYKFHNTHGIAFDSGGSPWLLQVSQKGVYAMPLPMFPATQTLAFREWIEEVGDDEILKVLDRFGGMPSGESFPVHSKDFEAWRRAGVIIKVCDTADFYEHIMYSSACGWSFNSRGSEGFNTCYDYYDDEGLGYGLAFGMYLSLGEAENQGKLPRSWHLEDQEQAARLDAYLSSIYRHASGNTDEDRALKYKLRRVQAAELLERASEHRDGKAEYEYWNAKEMEAIASHSGSVREVGRGYLYHPAKFEFQPQIKFPEPFWKGCISHDFLPLENGRYKDSYPNCDTIMFGYYVGDQLKVVKYFRETRTRSKPTENNYEDCMIVGSWEQTEYLSPAQIVGDFYTTDLDFREETSERTRETEIIGTDKGYSREPEFAFDAPFWMPGTLSRRRYYSHKTTTVTSEGRSVSIGVCIPYLDRNSLLHAKRDYSSGVTKTVSESLYSVTDPNSYRFYTYDFVMHWAGGPDRNGNAGSSAGETPYPKDSNPVWVVAYNYYPGGCSDFADQGDWMGSLPQDITWLVHPNSNEWKLSGGGGAPPFNSYSKTEPVEVKQTSRLDYSFADQPNHIAGIKPQEWYFYGSPDQFGSVFYRDCSRVVIGDIEYANVSEAASEGMASTRKYWGKTNLVDNQSAHHFIGVINE